MLKGIYNWSSVDPKTGEVIDIKTESLPPYEIVNIENSMPFDLSENIILQFDPVPSHYEIRLWDQKQVVSTYSSFDAIKERGHYTVEIVGYWNEGRVTYVCALQIM